MPIGDGSGDGSEQCLLYAEQLDQESTHASSWSLPYPKTSARTSTPKRQISCLDDTRLSPAVETTRPSLLIPMYHLSISSACHAAQSRRRLSSPLKRLPFELASQEKASDINRRSSGASLLSPVRETSALPERSDGLDQRAGDGRLITSRLASLVHRLSTGEFKIPDPAVDCLEEMISGMENILSEGHPCVAEEPAKHGRLSDVQVRVTRSRHNGITSSTARDSVPKTGSQSSGTTAAANFTRHVAAEAEALSATLEKTVESLRHRKEDTQHLFEMLVERAETAAARILELETEVGGLEDEIGENESDIKHLRIRLRAMEAELESALPENADHELRESIQNWKADWAQLKKRMSMQKMIRLRLRFEEGDISIPNTVGFVERAC